MAKARQRFWIGFWILVIIFGVDAAAGNAIFNALWQLLTILVDGLVALFNALMAKLSTIH